MSFVRCAIVGALALPTISRSISKPYFFVTPDSLKIVSSGKWDESLASSASCCIVGAPEGLADRPATFTLNWEANQSRQFLIALKGKWIGENIMVFRLFAAYPPGAGGVFHAVFRRRSARRLRFANWRVCKIQCAGSQKKSSATFCSERGRAAA